MARHARSTTAVAPAGRSIDSFGRVSKRVAPSSAKPVPTLQTAQRFLANHQEQKQQQQQQKTKSPAEAPQTKATTGAAPAPSTAPKQQRKRRASDLVEDAGEDSGLGATPGKKTAKRARRDGGTAKSSAAATLSIADFLTRSISNKSSSRSSDGDNAPSSSSLGDQAGHLLARLNLAATSAPSPSTSSSSFFFRSSSSPRSTSSSPRPASTAPTTPYAVSDVDSSGEQGETAALPQELLDLVHLQAAFAKTLVLHHAHHGVNAPVDVRELCPSVAQAWGKRRVTLDDVRRCLAMAGSGDDEHTNNTHLLFLADYGRGKICIEMRQPEQPQAGAAPAAAAGSVGDVLTEAFQTNLCARWAAAGESNTRRAIQPFVDALPRAPIEQCASLLQTSAVRAKGQRSLEELMRGIALKKEQEKAAQDALRRVEEEQAQPMDVETVSSAAAPMNLLDRIRYRQLQRAQLQAAGALAAPLTAAELERRAALQRVEDIADVLAMLCAGRAGCARVSLGLASILTKIKDSLRQPIAREEAAACVRLLAAEVAPQWLRLVSMGGREIVVMMPEGMPSKTAIQTRVQSLSQ